MFVLDLIAITEMHFECEVFPHYSPKLELVLVQLPKCAEGLGTGKVCFLQKNGFQFHISADERN